MEYRQLGEHGPIVSRIGFGCWAIGGHGYGNVDDRESERAIRRALDLGVTLFDTADVYGFGHSEEVLGRALGSAKTRVIVASKFGVRWDDASQATWHDCSVAYLRKAVEASLKRLDTDCIPLYQIHWYDGHSRIEDTMLELVKLKEEGKIRYIGCSNLDDVHLAEAASSGSLVSYQALYNVIDTSRKTVFEQARSVHVGTMAYSVLARGLLSGKYAIGTAFGPNDTRSRDPDFVGPRALVNLATARQVVAMGKAMGKSAAALAVRWVLESQLVDVALVGARTVAQVDAYAEAMGWVLGPADWDAMSQLE
ncbi:MAG: aldo/keto reductase [Caldisericia bacterium]